MTYALCILGGILAVVGDVFFKRWAKTLEPRMLVAGVIFYLVDAFVWALILRRGTSLSAGALLWSSTGMLVATAAGLIVFEEAFAARQWVGAVLILIGLVLS